MKSYRRVILILVFLLIIIWYVFDIALREKAQFSKDFDYFFASKTFKQIKNFAESALSGYQSGEGGYEQIRFLINALECNQYLLYANKIKEGRFYDFIRIILYPPQRIELKDKKNYVYEIKRYLRRKRNLEIKYLGYQVSKPIVSGERQEEFVRVHLIRTNAEGKEYLTYHFRKFKGRYYLYFQAGKSETHFTLSNH